MLSFAALLAVAATAVVLAVVVEGHRSHKVAAVVAPTRPVATAITATAPATTSATPTSRATQVTPTSAAATPSAALVTSVPSAPPAGITWALFHGVALPASAVDGPTKVNGPVYAGYTHSPVGALLAAAQLCRRYLITPGVAWKRVVEQQVLPGPGRDKYVAARAGTDASGGADQFGQTAGFKFVTYSPALAVVQFVNKFATSYQVTTDTVVWSDGDWKLQLQPDGGDSPSAQQVANLAGYIPWNGVN